MANDIYQLLSEPFDHTYKDNRGGVELDYLTGEQIISRLNEVLGVAGWSFRVMEHGVEEEADELWVLGEIAATINDTFVIRQQFGSQKYRRRRNDDKILDVGFDLKGATTDSLKKCASLLGVGLYLSKKEQPKTAPKPAPRPAAEPPKGGDAPAASAPSAGGLVCSDCGEALKETKFKDGTVWTPDQLAAYGRRKYARVLCMTHYREANDAAKRAQSLEAIAF